MEGLGPNITFRRGLSCGIVLQTRWLQIEMTGVVVIPMIVFIEGGMTIPMVRVTRDYLINHRLCPHQCAPNLFRADGSKTHLAQRRL